jgi:uncharacterized protein YkwD
VDYWLLPFYSTADEAGLAELSAALAKADLRRFGHCGLGVSRGSRPMAVLLFSDRALEIESLAVSPDPWTTVVVRGRVRPSVRLSGAYLGLPGGRVRRLVPSCRASGDFAVSFPLSGPGRYDLELSVDLGRGEETALLLPLYAGVSPAERPTVVPDDDNDAQVSAQTLLGYINATRERAGLSPLALSARLGELARKHSEEMAKSRFFGHVSPTAGDLLSRLTDASLSPGKYAENVARSRTLIRLHQNLKASPSHRMHLLDADYTHVGIGIAFSGEDLVVTEIFAKL